MMDFEEDSLDSAERDTLMLKLYTGAIYDDPDYIQLPQEPQPPTSSLTDHPTQYAPEPQEEVEMSDDKKGDQVNTTAGRTNFSDSNLEGATKTGQKDKREWKRPFNFLENDNWKSKQQPTTPTPTPTPNFVRYKPQFKRGWKEEEFCTTCCSIDHISEYCPHEGPMSRFPEDVVLIMKEGASLNCVNCGGLDHSSKDCQEHKIDKLVEIFYSQERNLKKIIDKFQKDYPRNESYPIYNPRKTPFTKFRRTLSAPNFRNNQRPKSKPKDKENTQEGRPGKRRKPDETTQKYIEQRQKEKRKMKKKFLKKKRELLT